MSATISSRDTNRRADGAISALQRPTLGTRRSWTRLMQYDMRLAQTLVESLWSDPDQFVGDGRVLVCKPGVRTAVQFSYEQQAFVLKCYQARSWRHAAKDAFLTSRARDCWLVTHRLIEAGVATPRPVAYLEDRFGPLRGRSFLIYEFVPGVTLRDRLTEGPLSRAVVDGLARQFDALWQTLRAVRVSHCDMNAGNFIVDADDRLWMIDLDKMSRHRRNRALDRARASSLARFLKGMRLMAEARPELAPWKQHLEQLPEA